MTRTLETAFPVKAAALKVLLADIPLVTESFDRPLSRCDLSDCRGICCTDGAPLDQEEAAVLSRLAEDEREAFEEMGLNPDRLVALTEDGGVGHTGLRSRKPGEFPKVAIPRLPETTCAAMLSDGRCGFQVLSEKRGHHPWYWKPAVCWLHPIVVSEDSIYLLPAGVSREDAYRAGQFATVTPCSFAGAGAAPSVDLLTSELEYLGALADRDFREEMREESREAGQESDSKSQNDDRGK